MRRFTFVPVVASATVLAIACSDTPTVSAPRRSPALRSASVTSAQLVSYPNAQKYRDAGFHPATGRSGSAAIAVRALLGRSGTTVVEVTTGAFEEGTAPGSLSSVQVKAYSQSGEPFVTRNHNGLSAGAASFPYAGLARGTPIQVQAVARGIDGTRSDVITVADAVHMRPDLVALRLEAPAAAPLGVPVNVVAFVGERHGDLGARSNCVLYVDGAAADRADGIWVDAGGVVACAMTHRFNAAGSHGLEVKVEDVRPGDYDESNNSATATISITEPSAFSTYSLQAYSAVDDSRYRGISRLTLLDGTVETWDQTYTRQGTFQYASINGLIPRPLSFPISLHGEMTTNGATVNTMDVTHASAPYVDWEQGFCTSSFSFGGGASTYVCVFTSGRLAGYTQVQYDWWGADVRYHSDSYVTSWDASGVLHERWIANDWTQVGPMVTFGDDFFGSLSVLGAGDTEPAIASATVPLSPFRDDFDYTDPGCSTTPVSMSCRDDHFHTAGIRGYIDYGSWPPITP